MLPGRVADHAVEPAGPSLRTGFAVTAVEDFRELQVPVEEAVLSSESSYVVASSCVGRGLRVGADVGNDGGRRRRSEEHTSELQSRFDLVCRLLLEKTNQHT